MRLTVNTKELKKAIKRVAFYKKAFQKSAKLTAGNNQLILETATDNAYSKEILDASVVEAGSVYLDTEELIKVVKSLKSKTAELYTTDNRFVIKANIEYKINTYHIDSFTSLDKLTGSKVYLHSFDLVEGIEKTAFALSKGRFREAIENLYFNFVKKSNLSDELEMVATDGYRLAVYRCEAYIGNYNGGLLIPKDAVEFIKKAFEGVDGDVEIYIKDKEATFKSGNYLLSIQTPSEATFEYKYPNYKSIFLKEEDVNLRVKLNTKEFTDIVKSLVATETKEDKPIILSFLNNKLTISNASGNHSVIDVEAEDKAFEIGVNGKYLLEALDVIYDTEFVLEMRDNETQIQIKADNYIYVLAPLRL
jgi:DNA polymerase III sliding clamp (beta) subunit (PCNA family)